MSFNKLAVTIFLCICMCNFSTVWADKMTETDKKATTVENSISKENIPTTQDNKTDTLVTKECTKSNKTGKFKSGMQAFFQYQDSSLNTKKIDVEKYLNLSKEQVKLAKQNRLDGEKEIEPYMKEIRQLEKKIERIEFFNAPSLARENQVNFYKDKIKEINKDADVVRNKNQSDFEKILTPEQLLLFKELVDKNAEKLRKLEEINL